MLDALPAIPLDLMAATSKAFCVRLGARIAAAHKAAGLTQIQLAEALGAAQQTLAHYEGVNLLAQASR